MTRYMGRRTPTIFFRALVYIALMGLIGCVADPELTEQGPVTGNTESGVMVVNEGLRGQDNSTLTYYNPADGTAIQNYFTLRNPGLRLGDTGNSIVIRNGRAYIAVSTSQAIQVVDVATGRFLGRITLPAGSEPRHVAILDDTTAFVTNLYDDSVMEFNPATFEAGRRIAVGPAPEGVAVAYGNVYVVNSGLGRFRKDEPKAGTMSVIDAISGRETATLHVGSNPSDIHFSKETGNIYVLYRPIAPDTLGGGVVGFNPVTRVEQGRWPIAGAVQMDMAQGSEALYVLGLDGVSVLNMASASPYPMLVIPNTDWAGSIAYSCAISPFSGQIYVGLTSDTYSIPGSARIYMPSGGLLGEFPCGINPGAMGFF